MNRLATFVVMSGVFLGAAAHAQTGQTVGAPLQSLMSQGAQAPVVQTPAAQAPTVTNPTILAPPVSAQPPSPPPFPNAEPPGYTPPGVALPAGGANAAANAGGAAPSQ
jgi:hypothetical protein